MPILAVPLSNPLFQSIYTRFYLHPPRTLFASSSHQPRFLTFKKRWEYKDDSKTVRLRMEVDSTGTFFVQNDTIKTTEVR